MFLLQILKTMIVSLLLVLMLAGCEGKSGPAGAQGGAGADGRDGHSALVKLIVEPAGTNCATGGQKLLSGIDSDADGVLSDAEVSASEFICNGPVGAQGSDAKVALVTVSDEAVGLHCEYGGQKIQSGLDDNGNGVLDHSEVQDEAYICNVVPLYHPKIQVKASIDRGKFESIVRITTDQAAQNHFELISARNADCNLTTLANCDDLEVAAIGATEDASVPMLYDSQHFIWLKNAYQHSKAVDTTMINLPQRISAKMFGFDNKLWLIGGQDLNGVSYNDIWSSADGMHWERVREHAEFSPRYDHQVVWFHDKLWLLGGTYSSDVWSSEDALHWTKETLQVSSLYWNKSNYRGHQVVVFQNKLWLIGGGSSSYDATSYIFSSVDGTTWKLEKSGEFGARFGHQVIVFDNKLWLSGGVYYKDSEHRYYYKGDIWSSEDGLSWTKKVTLNTIGTGHQMIVFKDKMWIIGGYYYNNYSYKHLYNNMIRYSFDGSSWYTSSAQVDFSKRADHQVAVFKGALWLSGGGDGHSLNPHEIWYSDNATSWSAKHPVVWNPRSEHQVVNFQNRLWLIGGSGPYEIYGDAFISEAGWKWEKKEQSYYPDNFKPRTGHQLINFQDKLWLIGGYDGVDYYSDIWSSSNGSYWSRKNAGGSLFETREGHQVAKHQQRLFLAGGHHGTTYYNDVWASVGGSASGWTEVNASAAFSPRSGHQLVSFKDKLWLIGGKTSYGAVNDIYSSNFGYTWTLEQEHAAFPARYGHKVIVYQDKLWLLGGRHKDSIGLNDIYLNDIWYSEDGINWYEKESFDFNFE